MRASKRKDSKRKRHYLDRRAKQILAIVPGISPPEPVEEPPLPPPPPPPLPPVLGEDALLTTRQVAQLLGVSIQWLEIGRCKRTKDGRRLPGWGPPFTRLGKRCIRYKLGSLRKWLQQRDRLTREADHAA